MPSLIVSIARRVHGLEAIAHFIYSPASSGSVCLGCGDWEKRDSIAPISLLDGGEVDPDGDSGAYLCEPCSMRLPAMRQCVREEWPATMTALEVERVWAMVRAEQKREAANKTARERARATGLDDVQRALAATQKARSHQGVDCAAEAV